MVRELGKTQQVMDEPYFENVCRNDWLCSGFDGNNFLLLASCEIYAFGSMSERDCSLLRMNDVSTLIKSDDWLLLVELMLPIE